MQLKTRSRLPLLLDVILVTLLSAVPSQAQTPTDSGSCIEFDGESWLQPERPFGFDLPQGYTLEMWFYYPSDGPIQSLVLSKNNRGFRIQVHKTGMIEYWYGKTEAGLFALDQWTHLAITWDTSWGRLFIDGREVQSVFTPGRVGENDEYLRIGDEGFVGYVDEFRIWDFAKTRGQILRQMKTPLLGNEDGLVTYFPFDEGTGQIAEELSGKEDDLQFGYTPIEDDSDPRWAINPIPGFAPPPSEVGQIIVPYDPVACDGFLLLEIRDLLKDGTEVRALLHSTVTSDSETLVLSAFPPHSSFFQGSIALSRGTIIEGDGVLQVNDGDQIRIRYADLDDGSGTSRLRWVFVDVDCQSTPWIPTPTCSPTFTETPTQTFTPTITPTPNLFPRIIYVDSAVPVSGTGLSWTDPTKSIKEALDIADGQDQIWIRSGTYEERIDLVDGVSLYGGFSGGETSIEERPAFSESAIRWIYFEEAAYPEYSLSDIEVGEESVIKAFNVHSATLDRLEISGGVATNGGGLHCEFSTLTIRDCTFENNVASDNGGGVYCSTSILDFERCLWRTNSAYNFREESEIAKGGGICGEASEIRIRHSRFERNLASGKEVTRGGALFGGSSNFLLRNIRFDWNHVQDQVPDYIWPFSYRSYYGSAISLIESCETSVENCLFVDNYPKAAIDSTADSKTQVIQTTIASDEFSLSFGANPESLVLNSILFGEVEGGPNINYSWVRNWPSGKGNIVDEYDLALDRATFRPLTSASIVDAGTPTNIHTDLLNAPRPIDIPGIGQEMTGSEYDMGAFEAPVSGYPGIPVTPIKTPTKTRTPTPTFTQSNTPTCPPIVSYPATFTPIPSAPEPKQAQFRSKPANPKSNTITLYVDSSFSAQGDGKNRRNLFTSIQSAIDSAGKTPATIYIQPGTYQEDILIDGQEIQLIADTASQKRKSIVDGKVPNNRVRLDGYSIEIRGSTDVKLSGFDIFRGRVKSSKSSSMIEDTTIAYNNRMDFPPPLRGGGIEIGQSEFEIRNSTIKGNWASEGGGIYARYSNVTIQDCKIEENEVFPWLDRYETDWDYVYFWVDAFGGGIYALHSSLVVIDSEINGNRANAYEGGTGLGGGIWIYADPNRETRIINSDISGNSS
ncbi:MAG: hypothetical protein KC994_14840, partial [Candidatus Omnitrophica bacterium]|nr:hypothetical protein [Candidatus Omnitrophota bacterium]